MEVITIDSQAFKELMAKINTIARFVTAINTKIEEQPEEEDGWVDSYEVCTFLKISSRTLGCVRKELSIFHGYVEKISTGLASFNACCKTASSAGVMSIYRI